MGEVLTNGVYLPDRGERNAYDGLKGNWNTLDSIAGKVPGYDGHVSDTDIHVTAADKQTWNGKADASHVHNADDVTTGVFDAARIPNLDASKITTGTIDIDRLPQGALERLVKVADQAARYALTTSDVQLGDTVQQLDTGVMYVVTDETKLDSADGYTEYTAGSATSVPWSGVTGKPADYTPASHSHGNITNDGKVGTDANKPLITGTGGAVQAGSFGNAANTFCEGNDSRLSDARTPVAHTHTKSDVTDLLNSNFIPSANNSYDLGSSSYQWNNLYAKNYYYNGVAWGLDKVNVWSNDQVLDGINVGRTLRLRRTTIEIGDPPPASGVTEMGSFAFSDKNNVNFGFMNLRDYANGNTALFLLCRQRYADGVRNTSGANKEAAVVLEVDSSTNPNFYPGANGTHNLGTSTNKWKTLNGVNPGALSLPDISDADPISTNNWVGDNSSSNQYTPTENGWIYFRIEGANKNITIRYGGAGGDVPSITSESTISHLSVFLPVRSGVTMYIFFNGTMVKAFFYPCLGNV